VNVQTLLMWPGRGALIQTVSRSSWILYYIKSSHDSAIVLLIIQSLMYLSSQVKQKDLINLGCIRTCLLSSHSLFNPSTSGECLLKNYTEAFGFVFTFPWHCGYSLFLLAAVVDVVGCLPSNYCSSSVLKLKTQILFPSLSCNMAMRVNYLLP
jgi:hypothetical protein